MELFGVGGPEMVVLAILAVVLFGERLPEVARIAARYVRMLREMSREFTESMRLDD